MKKLMILCAVLLMVYGCKTLGSVKDTQTVACKEACQFVYDECKQKAADNEIEKTACKLANDQCKEECKK